MFHIDDANQQTLHEAELIIAYKDGKATIIKDRYNDLPGEPITIEESKDRINQVRKPNLIGIDQMSVMKLGDVAIGSRVKLFIDSRGFPCYQYDNPYVVDVIDGMLVGRYGSNANDSGSVIAWTEEESKTKDVITKTAVHKDQMTWKTRQPLNTVLEPYTYVRYLTNDYQCVVASPPAKKEVPESVFTYLPDHLETKVGDRVHISDWEHTGRAYDATVIGMTKYNTLIVGWKKEENHPPTTFGQHHFADGKLSKDVEDYVHVAAMAKHYDKWEVIPSPKKATAPVKHKSPTPKIGDRVRFTKYTGREVSLEATVVAGSSQQPFIVGWKEKPKNILCYPTNELSNVIGTISPEYKWGYHASRSEEEWEIIPAEPKSESQKPQPPYDQSYFKPGMKLHFTRWANASCDMEATVLGHRQMLDGTLHWFVGWKQQPSVQPANPIDQFQGEGKTECDGFDISEYTHYYYVSANGMDEWTVVPEATPTSVEVPAKKTSEKHSTTKADLKLGDRVHFSRWSKQPCSFFATVIAKTNDCVYVGWKKGHAPNTRDIQETKTYDILCEGEHLNLDEYTHCGYVSHYEDTFEVVPDSKPEEPKTDTIKNPKVKIGDTIHFTRWAGFKCDMVAKVIGMNRYSGHLGVGWEEEPPVKEGINSKTPSSSFLDTGRIDISNIRYYSWISEREDTYTVVPPEPVKEPTEVEQPKQGVLGDALMVLGTVAGAMLSQALKKETVEARVVSETTSEEISHGDEVVESEVSNG
jgi:co-chaperonin GroES (HSP10)